MVINERPMKRRRRVTADFHDFFSFPSAGDAIAGAAFRSAVPAFLSRHARPAFQLTSLFPALMTWQILFRVGDLVSGEENADEVTLYVVEEDVTRTSRSIYCDHCRVVGWSGHPVCLKKYHFIILAEKNNATLPQHQQGLGQGKENIEESLYPRLEDTTHLLHGVVHSNGYGHLVTLNGREGGSKTITGCAIINFWDRLCRTIAVRKISVMDVSRKYGIEYRVLHAIAYGQTWYGKWGYEFGIGSYAIKLDDYQEAISSLSAIPLSLLSYQGRRPQTHLQKLISFYQSISDTKLETLRDLFSFMLLLILKTHGSVKLEASEKPDCSSITQASCQWSKDDVNRVEEALMKVLLATGSEARWVSKWALKGALARMASSELLDYCLKQLGGKRASNSMVVKSRCNTNNSAIEFRLEPSSSVNDGAESCSDEPSKEQLIHDLKYLYDSIVHPQTMTAYQSQAKKDIVVNSATKLLDCKHFVKDYKPDKPEIIIPYALYLWCHVQLADQSKDDLNPPPELLILPENVSISDLKLEATKAFQEVYVTFKKFEAEEMLDFGRLDDSMTLKLLVGSRGSVRVFGICFGTHGLGRFRMERGVDNWIVNCKCGTQDDDGERMLACDECEIWQHTRCAGIDNCSVVPENFVCTRCLNPEMLVETKEEDQSSSDNVDGPFGRGRSCRSAVVKNKGRRHMSVINPIFGVK